MDFPLTLLSLPSKEVLQSHFVRKHLTELRTPAMVIDRARFARNCARMHEGVQKWGASFRAHLKTHKTEEGTRLQLVSDSRSSGAVVVSTLVEAWHVANTSLVSEGIVNDILYGLPIGINKIAEVAAIWNKIGEHGAVIRLVVDHPDQIDALEDFATENEQTRKWSVFVKVDAGERRAGIPTDSPRFKDLLSKLFASSAVSVFGFYCHAGSSYASTSMKEASSFLSGELAAVDAAAQLAIDTLKESGATPEKPFVLSVGSTPTAHAATKANVEHLKSILHGTLEIHAGNYPMLDLQQLHTSLIAPVDIAQRILATVISYYPARGEHGADEALCDAGAIAMSKDVGPSGGFGEVVGKPWRLGRISQEHGILTRLHAAVIPGEDSPEGGEGTLKVGSQVQIVGQHACLIAAAHPWYYIVDSDSGPRDRVVDVWVPWKGW